jgi:hypothetical protein
LFEEVTSAVVQEGCRDFLVAGVLRVGLDHSAAGLGDQVQGTAQRDRRYPLAPVLSVHEEAGQPVVGQLLEIRFVLLSVGDAR